MNQPRIYETAEVSGDAGALIRRRHATMASSYRLMYDRPLELVRGEGAHLWTRNGEEMLDAYNNVQILGHSHPRVADAVHAALTTLNTNTRYLDRATLDYAETLTASHAPSIDRVVFTCTGSEANDLAIRIAQQATGNRGVIVTTNAYHGNTELSTAVSPSLTGLSEVPPFVAVVPDPRNGDRFVQGVAEAVERMQGIAALLVDSVFSSDGVHPGAGEGYLAQAADLVRAAGGMVISDEVQPGFGRLGAARWGYQLHDVEPEIVTMGKPMGNGYPIAAVAARAALFDAFGARRRYFNTFAGSAAAIAAASTTWDVLEDEGLAARAEEVGSWMLRELRALAPTAGFGEVRGSGLFLGVDIVDDEGALSGARAVSIVNALRASGVLIGLAGAGSEILKIRPPLAFSLADAARTVDALAVVADRIPTATLA